MNIFLFFWDGAKRKEEEDTIELSIQVELIPI